MYQIDKKLRQNCSAEAFYNFSLVSFIISKIYRLFLSSKDRMASIISVVIYSFERIAVSEIKVATSQSKIVEIAPRRSRLIFVIPRST